MNGGETVTCVRCTEPFEILCGYIGKEIYCPYCGEHQ